MPRSGRYPYWSELHLQFKILNDISRPVGDGNGGRMRWEIPCHPALNGFFLTKNSTVKVKF